MAQPTVTGLPSIGDCIRAWRIFRGLSSTELAEKAGVRSQYLSEIEHNRTANPQEEYLVKLTDALGVPLRDIYGRLLPPKKGGRPKRATGPTPSPNQPAAPMSTMAHAAIRLPDVLSSTTGAQIERLIASAGLSEEQEQRMASKLIEITKHLLDLIKPQQE